MPDLKEIKNYIFKNKKQTATIGALVLILLISCISVFSVKSENTEDTASDTTSQFVVFDYGANKERLNEQRQKEQLETLEVVAEPETTENLLSQMRGENDSVTLNIRTGGRSNPFSPYGASPYSPNTYTDIAEPPEYIPESNQAKELLQTTVSGILYNPSKSSAIINVDGTDQLVTKGDKIAGFQIVNITKDKVYLKKGYNITAAGVGESVEDALTYNAVYNLPNKFAGKYSKTQKGVILINGEKY